MPYVAHISEACPLTPAVRRLFELRASGLTIDEAAARLHRSRHTIKRQSEQLLAELGCRNINEAITMAAHEGWLAVEHVGVRIFRQLVAVFFMAGVLTQTVDPSDDIDMRRVRLVRVLRVRRETA